MSFVQMLLYKNEIKFKLNAPNPNENDTNDSTVENDIDEGVTKFCK